MSERGARVKAQLSAIAITIGLVACATTTTVPLLDAAGVPITATPHDSVPLEVVTRATAVRDPLLVSGADVSYADVETALGYAVGSAAIAWAAKHPHNEGLQLLVELTRSEAEYHSGRLSVSFVTRATLRSRAGGRYIAQTQARCQDAALVEPEKGAPVVYRCMTNLSRDLAAWLGGLDTQLTPTAPASSAL